MASYIKTSDGKSSPITIGSFIQPTMPNYTTTSAYRGQTNYGGSVQGTNLFSWIKTYYPADWIGLFNCWNITQGQRNVTFTGAQHALIGGGYIQFSAWGTWFDSGVRPFELGFGVTVKPAISDSAYNATAQTQWFMYRERISTETHDSFIQDLANGVIKAFFVAQPNDGETVEHFGIVFRNTYYTDYTDQYYNFYNANTTPAYWRSLLNAAKPSDGPDSSPDGQWGDFDNGSDDIALPGLPGLSALSSGFVNMYNPTASEITTMAEILWTTDPGTAIKNWLQAPMDSIVSLGIMPVAPDIASSKVHVVVGNFVISTNDLPPVYMDSYPLTNQYKIIDCGSLNMNEYWGNALDYSPYSKAEIFLPYIGVKEIDINDVMACTLNLQYIVDFLTGTCTAQLQCVKAQHMDFSAPLYHWQGNMMSQIPTNGADFGQFITAITSTLVSAGLTVATGGSGAVIAAGVAGGALNMANAHPRIEKGGTIAMIAGAMDSQTPYIILTRPIQSKPANFEGFKGWPSNITAEIGSLTGYTEIEYIHVEIDSATDEEKSEIERLLKEGVII